MTKHHCELCDTPDFVECPNCDLSGECHPGKTGHHINSGGQFQSDLHPDLPPDKIIVSFKRPEAWAALAALADGYRDADAELADDIMHRLASIKSELGIA